MLVKKIKIEYWIIGIILCYIPFHLLEEALGYCPLWMLQHHYTPYKLSYGHWMAVNIFFYYPILLLGAVLFFLNRRKFMFAGIGVLIWGFLNFVEHSLFTVIDLKYTAGLFTSIVMGAVAVFGFLKLKEMKAIRPAVIIPAVMVSLVYALLPVIMQILLGPHIRAIFDRV